MHEYNKCKNEEREEKLQLTYLASVWTSRFVWQKNIQSYEEITKQKPEKKEMTPEDMLDEIKRLNSSFGGTTF